MILILKNGATKEEITTIENALFKYHQNNGFDAKKYNGSFNIQEDALEIQIKLRDEWERDCDEILNKARKSLFERGGGPGVWPAG